MTVQRDCTAIHVRQPCDGHDHCALHGSVRAAIAQSDGVLLYRRTSGIGSGSPGKAHAAVGDWQMTRHCFPAPAASAELRSF